MKGSDCAVGESVHFHIHTITHKVKTDQTLREVFFMNLMNLPHINQRHQFVSMYKEAYVEKPNFSIVAFFNEP